jgi:hypothetical protein
VEFLRRHVLIISRFTIDTAGRESMAEEKKEPWLNYLALTTVVFAVCATLSTFKGGGFSTRSVLNQSYAADQWAYYQAKSIKGYL